MNSLSAPPALSAVQKPRKIIVPIAEALTWGIDNTILYQEKKDGRFATREIIVDHFRIATLAGEQTHDGKFWAFDCLEYLGADLRHHPLGQRFIAFQSIMEHQRLPDDICCIPGSRCGGQFLQEVLARGGEGVVRKTYNDLWGTPMLAAKRVETFYCLVTGKWATQSVEISRIIDPAFNTSPITHHTSLHTIPCGSVKLGGGKCDRVRVGSILKLEAFGLTANGQLREPRPDKDTPTSWLVKY